MPLVVFLSMALLVASDQAEPPPTFDATTEQSYKLSFDRLKSELPEARRQKFQDAVLTLTWSALQRADADATEAERHELMRQAVNGKSADDIIGEVEKLLRDAMEAERVRLQKVTSVRVPAPPVLRSSSLSCDSLLFTSIAPAEHGPLDLYEITERSFTKPKEVLDHLPRRIEASSAKGTDKLAIEVSDDVLRFMTRASLESGSTDAAEFAILKNTDQWLFAVDLQEGLIGASLSSFVLNKETGLAVWTKTRPIFLIYKEPDTQSFYLRCQ